MMNDEKIVIAGGGDLGREVAGWIVWQSKKKGIAQKVSFIDDEITEMHAGGEKIEYGGRIKDYSPAEHDRVLIAIGATQTRVKIAQVLEEKQCTFGLFIHDSAVVSGSANIQEGCIIMPNVVISEKAEIGRQCIINCLASIGHDSKIEEYVTISSHVDITGHCSIGTRVFIGSSAKVLPRTKLGKNSVIGAGSVIYRSVGENETMYAAPAKRLNRVK